MNQSSGILSSPEYPSLWLSEDLEVRKTSIWLLRILLLGILVRLLHLLFISRTAVPQLHFYYTQSDMHAFWEWSEQILHGNLLGKNPYHPYFDWMKKIAPLEQWYSWWGGKEIFQQSPLYPYLLATMRLIFKDSVVWIFFCQLMLGAFQPWIFFQLGRLFFDNRTGLAAALLTALYGPFIFHQGTLLRDWLPPILEPLALLLLVSATGGKRLSLFFAAGIAFAIAILAKERILLFVFLAIIYLLLTYSPNRKISVRAVAVLLTGLFFGLAPLIVRNAITGAPPLALSNRAAEGFIEANAVDSFPLGFNVPPSMGEILRASNGKSSQVIRQTLNGYHGNWKRFLGLQWLKLRALFDPMEIPNNLNFGYGVEVSLAIRFSVRYAFLIPLALIGLVFSLQSWRKLTLLYLYGGVTLFGLLLSSVSSRQRLVLVPVLILFSAWTLVSILQLLRTKQLAKAAAIFVALVLIASIQQVAIAVPELRERITYAIHPQEYLLCAQIYAADSNFTKAVEELQRLRRKAQESGFNYFDQQIATQEGGYRLMWAEDLIANGESSLAKNQIEGARSIYVAQKKINNLVWRNLGMMYLRINDRDNARLYLKKFLELEPWGKDSDEVRKVLSTLE